MKKLDLAKIVEGISEAKGPKMANRYKFITPEGKVNLALVPTLKSLMRTYNVTPDDFDRLINLEIPGAENVLDDIKNQDVRSDSPNPVYQFFKNVMIKAYKYSNQTDAQREKNVGVKERYIGATTEFKYLGAEMLSYSRYKKRQDAIRSKRQSGEKNTDILSQKVRLGIKDFKNLSAYIYNTPQFRDTINDQTFDDFLDTNNQQALDYYNLMISNNDDGDADDSRAGQIYGMFKKMRADCELSVRTFADMKYNMDRLANHYGHNTNSGGNKRNVSQEFFPTTSLNMNTVHDEDLVKFKYRLQDINGKPYRNSTVVYEGTFTYHPLRRTYSFINNYDLNNEFLFENPKPNPIDINKVYYIEYSDSIASKAQIRIEIVAIEVLRKHDNDVTNNFMNCSAVEELKELLKNIKQNQTTK